MSQRLRNRAAVIASSIVLGSVGILPLVAQAGEAPVIFRIGVTQGARPVELNPFQTTSGMGYSLLADRYDLLVGFGEDLSAAPGLAETWSISDDGLVWTYGIRGGATWQDGLPVTAEDVRFTFQYIIDSHDPAYTGPAAPAGNDTDADGSADNPLSLFDNYLDLDGGLESMRIIDVAAPDATTVTITTSEPLATLSQMFIPILPKHIWETIPYAQSANERIELDQAIGSGPFQIVEFQNAQFMRLIAHDGYWGGRPHIDELIYQYFENDEAQVNALGDGSVDFLDNFPPGLISALEGDPNITINRAPSTDFAELGFNSWEPTPERFAAEGCPDCPRGPTTGSMGNPWVTRVEVRAALAGLLDKQHLVEFALNGAGTPGLSLVSPLVPAFHYAPPEGDPVMFPTYADEAGRASARAAAQQRFRDVMAAIGFTDTDGNSILNVPDTAEAQAFDPSGAGQDWSLRLFVRQDDREDIRAGELIAQWFTEAGAQTELRQVSEDPQLYDATYPSSSNADYDMYLWGWGPDPDPDFILSIFSCVQINNWQDANYCNAEYDEQYRATRTQVDAQARAQDIRDLQDFLYHDSPYAVLWYVDTLEAYRSDRWEGFNAMPRAGGALWSTYGMGPWGSRTTVGPIGAAGATPSPAPTDSPTAPPTASPTGAEPSPSDSSSPSPTAVVSTPPETIPPSPTAGPTAAPSPAPSGTGSGGTGGGDSTPLVVGGAVVVVAALAGVWWWRRRSLDEDDRD